MRTLQRRKIITLTIFSFLGLFFLSTLTAGVISIQIFSQLKDLSHNKDSLQSQDISSLHMKMKVLDLSLSNPVVAVGASLLISPGSYSNLSSAVSSGKQVLAIADDYWQKSPQSDESLISLAKPLEGAMPALNELFNALAHLHLGGIATPFDGKALEIRKTGGELALASKSLTPLVSILPALAGAERPHRFLLAFQNSAEARGTGGILGAYAVLTADKGKITFSQFGSNANLAQLQDVPVKMPSEYIRLYNDDPGIWQNSNISPHFPYGAKIWLALWERQFNEKLDGVVTFDPIALSYLLKATGPVMANDQEITSNNVVQVTLSDVYKKYETNNDARKKFLINIIKAVSERIENGKTSPLNLAQSLIAPLNQNRLLIYSRDTSEQKVIQSSTLSGAIRTAPDNLYRLIIQNTSGNKMDYYLERKLSITSIQCSPRKKTKVTFTLSNTAKSDLKLPSYVMGRLDLQRPKGLNNSYGTRAIILAPVGARIVDAKDLQTGRRFGFLVRERGHMGLGVQVDLAAGQSQTYTVTFSGGVGKLSSHEQPLVNPQTTRIEDRCSS